MSEACADLRRIEECSFNAMPALQQVLLGGWVLRLAAGYSRRANSVNAFYPSEGDVDKKIALCERFYRARGLSPTFRLTPFVSPPDLDERLIARGYQQAGRTCVMCASLDGAAYPIGNANRQRGVGAPDGNAVALDGPAWIDVVAQVTGRERQALATLQAILAHTWPSQRLLALWEGDQPVACGRAVLEDHYLGLFGIETAPTHRRRGYGRRMVEALLSWGQAQGADTAYLQVVATNEPARRLYDGFGFQLGYVYWYRALPGKGV